MARPDPFDLFGATSNSSNNNPLANQAPASAQQGSSSGAAATYASPIVLGNALQIGDHQSLVLLEHHLSLVPLIPLLSILDDYHQTPAQRAVNQAALDTAWDTMKNSALALFRDHVRCPGCGTMPLDQISPHQFNQEVQDLYTDLVGLLAAPANGLTQDSMDMLKQKFIELEVVYIRAERPNSC